MFVIHIYLLSRWVNLNAVDYQPISIAIPHGSAVLL